VRYAIRIPGDDGPGQDVAELPIPVARPRPMVRQNARARAPHRLPVYGVHLDIPASGRSRICSWVGSFIYPCEGTWFN
jgi:hypothetical protein